MEAACGRCGAVSASGARFCMRCGAPLSAGSGAVRSGAGPAAGAPRPRANRRGHRGRWLLAGALLGAPVALWLAAGAPFHLGDRIAWLLSPDSSASTTVTEQGGVLELEGLRIEFGPEALPAGAVVKARRLASVEERYPRDAWLQLAGPVYLVETPEGLPQGATVRVTLPYDAARAPDPEASGLSGAVWDGTGWELRPSAVDTAARTVSFVVDHFSPVAPVYRYSPAADRAALETPRFLIRFGTLATRPLEEPQYVSPLGNRDRGMADPLYVSPTEAVLPAYVQDLGTFLEQAYDRLQSMGYTMPPAEPRIEVWVEDLSPPDLAELLTGERAARGGLWGRTGVSGPVYIDRRLADADGTLAAPDQVPRRLRVTAGHELFHVVQRNYPSFPTWFYEAGAAFMEWRLYEAELPGTLAEHVSAHPQFLYEGMWGGNVGAHYAKAALLAYLQDTYGQSCSGPSRDVLKDGVFTSGLGGSAALHAAANLRVPDMSAALLAAARTCGRFNGTWAELLEEFARRYYVEWEGWGAVAGLLGSRSRALIYANPGTTEAYNWRAYLDAAGAYRFPVHRWRRDSAALWRVEGNAADLLATLVLEMKHNEDFERAGMPQYWVYPFVNDQDRGPAIGPRQFTAREPTVAVQGVGGQAGARFQDVFVLGVNQDWTSTRPVQGRPRDAQSGLRAYLLPAPKSVQVEPVEVEEGGRKVPKLRVSWAVSEKWLPREEKGLYHVVGMAP
ncbi:MAG: zinc ribbon domain-containing protein, partial [Chloroflexi bacterium]|nr:zinc ribbon domain-containing protein [Chloroflexota bacterium]